MLAMILIIKQMIMHLRQNRASLPKVRDIKYEWGMGRGLIG